MATTKPQLKDAIGTYVFEKQNLTKDLKSGQTQHSEITLNSDSTFTAVDIPNFTGKFEFHYQGVISVKGKWNIDSNGGVANSSGGTDPIWGVDLTSIPENLQHIEFLGKKPPYKLIVTYGDPDQAAVMIFKKL